MYGLALEGGGAKGSYQIGAYLAFKKKHIKFDVVVGTSIGSFNGAMIAAHEEKKLLSLWRDASMNDIMGFDETKLTNILKGDVSIHNVKGTAFEFYKIIKNKGIDIGHYKDFVEKNVNEKKVRKSNIKYGLTTIKVERLKPLELFIDDILPGKLHDYIVASSFLPCFKKEKLVDDKYYLDGGFYNLSPVDMLIKSGCKKIYVVNIKGVGFRKPVKKNDAEIIQIKPTDNLGSIIYFNKDTTERNIIRGYNDTLQVLGDLDGNKFYFKKRSSSYYARINKKIRPNTYLRVSRRLKTHTEKETIIMAIEYIMNKEKQDDLKIYKVAECIEYIKNLKSRDYIYDYVKLLGAF